MGSGTFFWLVGKMQKIMEKLGVKNRYQFAIRCVGVLGIVAKKLMNRL
jgi:hypothetical protein